MAKKLNLPTSEIFLTCIESKYLSKEAMFTKNTLIRVVSGEMKVLLADQQYIFRAGDTFLFPQNQLAKIIKYPIGEQPFQSIAIYLNQIFLEKHFGKRENISDLKKLNSVKIFGSHLLLDSLFYSLLPYFEIREEIPTEIITTKIQEAIHILHFIDPDIYNIIGQISQPSKIDLEEFMEKNFVFNLPIVKFAYLTGRSISTFQRDFRAIYGITPQRWLTKKRLTFAHHQIADLRRKPSEVYFEVGFENLSHFSFAYKKEFGFNATDC